MFYVDIISKRGRKRPANKRPHIRRPTVRLYLHIAHVPVQISRSRRAEELVEPYIMTGRCNDGFGDRLREDGDRRGNNFANSRMFLRSNVTETLSKI